MGRSPLYSPYWWLGESQSEAEAEERKLQRLARLFAESDIKKTIENTNKKGLKGLDALLSVFSELSKKNFTVVGEGYLRKEMKKLDYKVKDVQDFAGYKRVYNDINETERRFFMYAAIKNVIKPGEKVYIKTTIDIKG